MDVFELLGVLAVIAVLAIPVAVVVLLISVSGLKTRVTSLETRLSAQEKALRTERAAQAIAEPPAVPKTDAAATVAPPTPHEEVPAEEAAPPLTVSGPWSEGVATAPARPDSPPAGPARVSALGNWLKDNWVYAVSALSLALAGIFFVQYGMEKGLLPPGLRIMAAIAFGGILIAGGEWMRRRHGDGENAATAYLPSVFAGAGLVSIFAGIIAGRQLYGLIGPEAAFLGLLAAAALAIVLGWFYGPFLAGFGLIGAAAAPFLVGGDSEAPYWLYGYYALIAGAGLAIDTIRRWAWVSILALVLGYAGAALVFLGTGGPGWFALMLVAMVVLSISVPARGLIADHGGPMLAELLTKKARPEFPTMLAAGAVAASSLILVLMPTDNAVESTIVYFGLTALAVALAFWSGKARALSDLTILPAAAFLVRLGFDGIDSWPLAQSYHAGAITLRAPETSAPMTAALLLGLGVLISLSAAWVSGGAGRLKPFWAAGAALVAPLAALVLELFWAPAAVLGSYGWALHVIALSVLMVAMAGYFVRHDGDDMRRAAYATLSALSLIALALFLITTKGALTLALAVLAVVAAVLDRRFKLPEMGWFIQAAVVALSWRLVIDPGLLWAVEDAALWEVLASYGGSAAAMGAVMWLLKGVDRRGAQVFAESGGAAFAALLVNVLIMRQLIDNTTGDWIAAHWALSLNAMPWLILMLVQLYRLKLGGRLNWLRWGIAAVAAILGFGGMLAASLPANPLMGFMSREEQVYGPHIFDTLFVAYALPGILLLAVLSRLGHLPLWLNRGLMGIGAALMALYASLEIRRFWRGDDLSLPGVTQPELYSYTVALMVLGAALLYQAIARRSPGLRRIAMGVIALTVAKVFLIDASGLTGLTRVFSFLALGLSLAGLAWLNRWAAGQQGDVTEDGTDDAPD
ncbi:MAG: DUF2339 domain-containing protein [Albidovulum sp.]